jgi:hypothetical protein
MTMANKQCDICHRNRPLRMVGTILPYSCASCEECAKRFAQPQLVFDSLYGEIGTNFDKASPVYLELVTYQDGAYVTYRQWARAQAVLENRSR